MFLLLSTLMLLLHPESVHNSASDKVNRIMQKAALSCFAFMLLEVPVASLMGLGDIVSGVITLQYMYQTMKSSEPSSQKAGLR